MNETHRVPQRSRDLAAASRAKLTQGEGRASGEGWPQALRERAWHCGGQADQGLAARTGDRRPDGVSRADLRQRRRWLREPTGRPRTAKAPETQGWQHEGPVRGHRAGP